MTFPAEMFIENIKTELRRVRYHLKQFVTVKNGTAINSNQYLYQKLAAKRKITFSEIFTCQGPCRRRREPKNTPPAALQKPRTKAGEASDGVNLRDPAETPLKPMPNST